MILLVIPYRLNALLLYNKNGEFTQRITYAVRRLDVVIEEDRLWSLFLDNGAGMELAKRLVCGRHTAIRNLSGESWRR